MSIREIDEVGITKLIENFVGAIFILMYTLNNVLVQGVIIIRQLWKSELRCIFYACNIKNSIVKLHCCEEFLKCHIYLLCEVIHEALLVS